MKRIEFGKILQNLRLKEGHLYKHMADKLGTSPAVLCSVELGRSIIPDKWIDCLCQHYDIDETTREELSRLKEENNSIIRDTMRNMTELVAKRRGYELLVDFPDKKSIFRHPDYEFYLVLYYSAHEEYELHYSVGNIEFSTGKLDNFSDESFFEIEELWSTYSVRVRS